MNQTTLPSAASHPIGSSYRNWHRLTAFAVILLAELVALGVAYQLLRDIQCLDFGHPGVCYAIRNGMGRALAILALLVLYIPARRSVFGFLWHTAERGPLLVRRPLFVVAAGFVLALLPILAPAERIGSLLPVFALVWAVGLGLSAAGVLASAGRWSDWLGAMRAGGVELALLLSIALIAPELTEVLNGAWGWPLLTDVTFNSVAGLLALLPGEVTVERNGLILGLDDFVVSVGQPCSGLQGFALILLMLTGYLTLYRSRLRMPHALLLLPIGLVASFALNVVRIAMLIWVGARISPDLAENGFHSHAGWLMFTLLSFGLIGLSLTVPQFQAKGQIATTTIASVPLRQDRVVALLVPLMVFLLSGLVASTFFEVPDIAYPLRVIAMAGVLAFFLPVWRGLDWRMDRVALLSGVGVGIVWIAFDRPGGDAALGAALAALPPLSLAMWIAARVLGTVLLVPLIEEAAFRAYLVGELPPAGDRRWAAAAALLAAVIFSTLHSNTALAFGAGLVFAGVFLRRRRLADAFWAHAAANLIVAAAAMASGDWGAI